MMDDTLLWDVRAYIYGYFATTTRAPDVDDIARRFDLSQESASEALHALHDKHALFLEPNTTRIRIANPFSAIPTQYQVEASGKTYQANCAWDSFGVVAALGLDDAIVRSVCTGSGEPLRLNVANGEAIDNGTVAHFLVPFRHWYDDLVFT